MGTWPLGFLILGPCVRIAPGAFLVRTVGYDHFPIGGVYGSGVPGAIGGYRRRLCSNSVTIRSAGWEVHPYRTVPWGYSSLGSVVRSKIFGTPSFVGGVHQSRWSS